MPSWLIFLLSAGAVVAAGSRLSHYGDALAERTGLGGAWMGAVLVAGATSLPELATGIYAVRAGQVPLAVGDIFGSCMANLLILAIADLCTRQVHVLSRVTVNQVMVGTLAILLLALSMAGILSPTRWSLAGVGWSPLLIGVSYLLGMRLLHINRGQGAFASPAEVEAHREGLPSVRAACIGFGLAALAILIAARFLAGSAEHLAHDLGLSTGFVGLVLLALTTSLPEVTVSIAAVRSGSYDLAVGNLLGSNCFNCAILVVHDVVDGPGDLLSKVPSSLMLAAVFAIVLTAQALLGITHRTEKRIALLEPDALLLILTYVLGLVIVYLAGK